MDESMDRGAAVGRLLRIMNAARLHKVLPLVLVVLIASQAVEGDVDWVALAACCVFVFLIITLGMHLNAITDRALDRRLKPHLADWTEESPRLLGTLMGLEVLGAAGAAALAVDATRNGLQLAALIAVALLSLSYSFNLFVPYRGAELRAKIHWLGHFVSIGGSYAAIWLLGLTSTRGDHPGWFLVSLACAWALVDYALFLHESANDAEDECAAGLRTLPALLGPRRTSLVALGLLALGIATVVPQLQAFPGGVRFWLTLMLLLQTVGCLMSAFATRSPRWRALNERMLDFVFWAARLLPALGLTFMRGWS